LHCDMPRTGIALKKRDIQLIALYPVMVIEFSQKSQSVGMYRSL
jgi:hypothetical protein